MTPITEPVQHAAKRVTDAWTALPSWLPVPGLGALPINSFLLTGTEPMLVDTGLGALAGPLIDSLRAQIDPEDLRWIWLSHTDADHIGNLDRILEIAPNATVVTNFLGAGKMGMLGAGDPARMRTLEPGEVFEVGGRRLHQVKPPYYDAPETMGFFDETDRVFFAADAFGALLPGSVDTIDEIPVEELGEGLVAWSSVDAPWLVQMDRGSLGQMLRALDALDPAYVLSGHLPVAHRLDTLTGIVGCAYGRGTTAAVTPETAAQVEAILA
ncbi:MAG TPA: MBL fold metallo-hydrolase [Amaricoccus sp.]|uniref:MBL fold metallo-hydrolase n=1 Tax=Amaricoccus sp. TaxID=1872485 RepID=UPI002C983F5C|nr:MBL fold metallo-hydrolase [Amaricoccus sp.]HMQ94865.1 MBL fold metallo-hydrolase [Amaricoccus sp.]HMR54670.1 MBL fold metallo-hydrolase [Amaricoccus sp.]HMU01708.1 MBL fold metallo-hydrolase [Amaricoccus sp.]